jgi:hypothetical protein
LPQIFDNVTISLGEDLRKVFQNAVSMDSVVGYFNLRGYKMLAQDVEDREPGEKPILRILVGMAVTDETRLDRVLKIRSEGDSELDFEDLIDRDGALSKKNEILANFRAQLEGGTPNNLDRQTLTTLRNHLDDGRVQIKVFAEQPLHAKAYILHTPTIHQVPRTAYVGSSNWTMAGMTKNLELNVDVVDQDATQKLHLWFEERWNSQFCLDVTVDVLQILSDSWATSRQVTPYELFLKVCYNLSLDAREGIDQYSLPEAFD